jgi:hypothetical protein
MEPKGLLLCSKQPAIGPFLETYAFSSHIPTLCLYGHIWGIVSVIGRTLLLICEDKGLPEGNKKEGCLLWYFLYQSSKSDTKNWCPLGHKPVSKGIWTFRLWILVTIESIHLF